MDNSIKISIITVCYNAELFLERTIQSVVNQTYSNIEYIIVDGKSSDNTLNIILKYTNEISKWISEKDKSLYDAMNKGINLATGDYVWFLNAGDTIYDKFTLSNIVESLEGVDFCYGDILIINEKGETRIAHKKKPSQKELSYKSFIEGMVISHQSMIAKRELIPQYALTPWKIANDIDWSIRLLKKCKTIKETNFIWCKFLDGGVSDKNRIKAVKERFFICVEHFGWIPTIITQFKILCQVLRKGKIH